MTITDKTIAELRKLIAAADEMKRRLILRDGRVDHGVFIHLDRVAVNALPGLLDALEAQQVVSRNLSLSRDAANERIEMRDKRIAELEAALREIDVIQAAAEGIGQAQNALDEIEKILRKALDKESAT